MRPEVQNRINEALLFFLLLWTFKVNRKQGTKVSFLFWLVFKAASVSVRACDDVQLNAVLFDKDPSSLSLSLSLSHSVSLSLALSLCLQQTLPIPSIREKSASRTPRLQRKSQEPFLGTYEFNLHKQTTSYVNQFHTLVSVIVTWNYNI